ncbi:hypothetical protein D9M71_442030 [compost metagenome]
MAEAVLQRQHQRLWAYQREGTGDGLGSVKRLHQHHHQVGHANVFGFDGRVDRYIALAPFVLHPQTMLVHRLDMRAAAVQQPGFMPCLAQGRANGATQCTGAQNADFHVADLL